MIRFDRVFFFDLKTGAVVFMTFQAVFSLIAFFYVFLDFLDVFITDWNLPGKFKTEWRMHIWREWVALDCIMFTLHAFIFGLSVFCLYTLLNMDWELKKTITRSRWLKFWIGSMIVEFLTEAPICAYEYSWMGLNQFYMPYNAFEFIFWCLRIISSVIAIFVIHNFARFELERITDTRGNFEAYNYAMHMGMLGDGMSAGPEYSVSGYN